MGFLDDCDGEEGEGKGAGRAGRGGVNSVSFSDDDPSVVFPRTMS